MATPAEIANDLDAQARRLERTGNDHLVSSMERGATCIRDLLRIQMELEAAAQAEADRYDRYVSGGDL